MLYHTTTDPLSLIFDTCHISSICILILALKFASEGFNYWDCFVDVYRWSVNTEQTKVAITDWALNGVIIVKLETSFLTIVLLTVHHITRVMSSYFPCPSQGIFTSSFCIISHAPRPLPSIISLELFHSPFQIIFDVNIPLTWEKCLFPDIEIRIKYYH